MAFVPIYIFILGFTIVIDYFAGILIENSIDKRRKIYLIISLISNIGVLAVFKYYNFIIENFSLFFSSIGLNNHLPYLSILLPIGLSFHTFQAMSYTIEVYRGNQKAERHFGIYSLYVMFYPQLVAGPIERPQHMIHQFYEKHEFDYQLVTSGLKLMLWGFFKKVVIADRLAIFVNKVYDTPHNYSGIPLIVTTILFTFQIYCDFSGYSDIAIGSARVMGFRLMKNFNLPLSATSITELWRRWHISLSSWINDYLFNPLTIKLRDLGTKGILIAILISFSLIGLWHGANWKFIIFGFIQAIFICFELLTKKIKKRVSKKIPHFMYNFISMIFTFSFFSFSCIFFRAHDLNDAFYIISHLFADVTNQIVQIIANANFCRQKILYLDQKFSVFFIAVISIVILEIIQYLHKKGKLLEFIRSKSISVRWSLYIFVIISILLFGVYDNINFIYFQF